MCDRITQEKTMKTTRATTPLLLRGVIESVICVVYGVSASREFQREAGRGAAPYVADGEAFRWSATTEALA
jgi:hypothetical protein